MDKDRKIDIKAVLMGFLADTFATMAIFVALVSAMSAAGIAETEITRRMDSLNGLLLSLIFGLGCTVGGGYLAGRIAKRSEVLHGALVAGAGLVLGLFLRESGMPLWYEVASFLLIVPAGMTGGYLAFRHRTTRPAGTA